MAPLLASLLLYIQAQQAGLDSSRAKETELANDIMHTLSPATFTGGGQSPEDAARAARIRSRVRFGGWHGDGEHAVKIAAYERAEEEDQAARQQGVTRIWTRARFQNSSFVTELSRKSAPGLLRRNLPFAVFMLCDCPDDMDWHLPKLEHLLREDADGLRLLERLVLLYTQPSTAAALELHTMYATSAPALVIDNVPEGARNERYHFPGNSTSPPEETYRFLARFVNGSATPTLAGGQKGHHSLRYKLADILGMHGDAKATGEAVDMLEDEMEIAARDGSSDSDRQLLEAHAGHLCMLYLEQGTEQGAARAAELHAKYPSAEHCTPPEREPPAVVRQDCGGEWSSCSELCEAAQWRVWTQRRPPLGGGSACPQAIDCQPGEGDCSAAAAADRQEGGVVEGSAATLAAHPIAARNKNAHGHTLYNGSEVGKAGHSSHHKAAAAEEEAPRGERGGDSADVGVPPPPSPLPPLPPPPPPTPPLEFGEAASLAAFQRAAKHYSDPAAPGAVGELKPQTVNRYLQAGRPFVVFLLCSCERDTDWHIEALQQVVQGSPALHGLSLMWTSPLTAKRFQLSEMYGVPTGEPALVIDNIPFGPMNERYVFKHSNR